MARPKKSAKQENGGGDAEPKTRKPRQLKDKNAPKRPSTAFMVFSMERRPEIERKFHGIKMKDLLRMTSTEWKAMNEETKQGYNSRAANELAQYNEAMKEYEKSEQYRDFQTKVKAKHAKQTLKDKSTHDEPLKKKRKTSESAEMTDPHLDVGTSQIKIFSNEFLLYNKEQEKQLRHLRRQVNTSVDEANSLRKVVEEAEGHCEALRSEIRSNDELLETSENTFERWQALLKRALRDALLPTDLRRLLHDDFDGFLSTVHNYQLGRGDELGQQALSVIRTAINQVAFD